MSVNDIIAWVQVPSHLMAIGYVVTWAAAVVPQGAPGTAWGIVRSILDLVAANVGNAANKTKPAV